MKNAVEQLSQYKSVHFNKKNIQTHFIGVPLIIWAITVLLSLNSFTISLFKTSFTYTPAMVFFSIALLYYFKLHWRLALGLLVYLLPNIYLANLVSPLEHALTIGIVVFIIGWVFQFIGHHYEKAKPAFIEDLMQFLIGPFFLMAEIYFALGFEQQLKATITPLARDRRRAIEAAKRVK